LPPSPLVVAAYALQRHAMMKVVAILNDSAGTRSNEADGVRKALALAEVDVDVRIVPGQQMAEAAREAAARGVEAVVAGGGDGTVSAIAGALAGTQTRLGVLPFGTLNHFAKDNGIPLDLAGAAAIIEDGYETALDVGRVNGRVFVNNSSLGVYARALINRDVKRDHLGMGKWPAMALAVWKVFRRSPLLRVELMTDGETQRLRTPLVFVGNNRYDLELFRVGTRACLDEGVLSLYVAKTSSRWGMLKLGVRSALGRLEQSRDFETRCVTSVRIGTRRKRIHVALDGEVVAMDAPLEYEVWPGALRVFVPRVRERVTSRSASEAVRAGP
jgi:diacylglycerol kinase family enzyme